MYVNKYIYIKIEVSLSPTRTGKRMYIRTCIYIYIHKMKLLHHTRLEMCTIYSEQYICIVVPRTLYCVYCD